MDVNRILNELKSERDRLDRAIAALEGGRGAATGVGRGNGRRGNGRRGRRKMSADSKRRISEAMRKRWAERRKKA